jgi:hypothetical protein
MTEAPPPDQHRHGISGWMWWWSGGNSGFQIAEELAASRPVDLSIATPYPMLPSGWPVGTCSGG